MRRLYADWILRDGAKKLKDPDQAPILKKFFGGTALADPKSWIQLDNKAATATDIMRSSPGLRLQYQHDLSRRLSELRRGYAEDAVKWGLQHGKNLGSLGETMATQVKLAKTPEEGAQIVAQFVKGLPGAMQTQYQGELAQGLSAIGRGNAQDVVKWALQHGKKLGSLGEEMTRQVNAARTPEEGAQVAAAFIKRLPEAMPLRALQEGRVPSGHTALKQWLGRLKWLAPWGIASTLTGHPNMYSVASLALGVPIALHEGMQRTLKYALRNPETAQMFWEAINNPSSHQIARKLGRLAADALMAQGSEEVEQHLTGSRLAGEDRGDEDAAAPAVAPAGPES
jgi:hypothetical protein